jgi:hypothetical protein
LSIGVKIGDAAPGDESARAEKEIAVTAVGDGAAERSVGIRPAAAILDQNEMIAVGLILQRIVADLFDVEDKIVDLNLPATMRRKLIDYLMVRSPAAWWRCR